MASRSGVRETFSSLAQLALVELGAGRDAPFHQHLAQPLRHLLVQGGARDGDDFGGHGRYFVCKKTPVSNVSLRGIDT
jgi:hypothetical protein